MEEPKLFQDTEFLSDLLGDEITTQVKQRRKKRIIITSCIAGGLALCGVIAYLIYFFLNRSKVNPQPIPDYKVLYSDNQVSKSLISSATVQIIQLSNGLNATLISHPGLATFQTGMIVHSGFINDGSVEGLAHFTEHMLFLGSKKYPEPAGFDNILAKYKGMTNAMTDIAVTLYYYDVLSSGIEITLDMFSEMIKHPALTPSEIEKEINAVDSEFDKLTIRDDIREAELISRLYGGRFTNGNNISLKKISTEKLLDAVRQYHLNFHYASNMHLVMYSNATIDTMRNYAITYFKDIPSQSPKQVHDKGSDTPSSSIDYINKMGKLIWFESLMPIYFLEFIFTLPYNDITNTPFNFIEYLLDDRSEKAFQTIMKKKNYIERMVNIKTREDIDHFEFSIGLVLKKEGFSKVIEISEALFSFLNMLKIEPIDPRLYEEFRSSTEQQKSFTPLDPAIEVHLQNIYRIRKELKYVLDASPWVKGKYDEAVLKSYLNYFTVQNCIIVLGASINMDDNEIKEYSKTPTKFFTTKLTDEYFGTKYNVNDIKDEVVIRLNNMKDYKEFGIRPYNEYTSKEKELIRCNESSEGKEMCNEELKLNAKEIIAEKNMVLYHKTDRSFLLPVTSGRFRFIYPGLRSLDPKTYTMTQLFEAYLQQRIKTELNDAFITGNSFFLAEDENGITLDISSYSDIFEKVITNTMSIFFNHKLTQTELNGLLEELQNIRENSQLLDSYELGELIFRKIVKANYRTDYGDIDSITADQAISHFNTLSRNFIIDAMFYGTITSQSALNVYNKALKGKIDPTSTVIQAELGVSSTQEVIAHIMHHTPIKGSFVYRARSNSPYEDNHFIINLYHIGHYTTDFTNIVYANLIKISWGRLFFIRLRTELQLGYTVESTVLNQDFNFYIRIVIQGNIETPKKMNDLIDDVIKEGEAQIANASMETFNEWKEMVKIPEQWVMATKTEQVFKMVNNRLSFEERDIEGVVRGIGKEDLIKRYREIFYSDVHKLSVQIYNAKTYIEIPMENEVYYLNKEIMSKVSNSLNILNE